MCPFAELTTVAYCNEHLYIQADSHAESFRRSGEPEPQRIQDLNQVLKMYDVQKVVFCGDDAHLRVRLLAFCLCAACCKPLLAPSGLCNLPTVCCTLWQALCLRASLCTALATKLADAEP